MGHGDHAKQGISEEGNVLTISAIKADIGSVGGHTCPSARMVEEARAVLRAAVDRGVLLDLAVTYTGDDICLLMSHRNGSGHPDVHNLAWEAFTRCTEVARSEGLYAAGQDLLKDAPSGNVRGAGPGSAKITFDVNLAALLRDELGRGPESRVRLRKEHRRQTVTSGLNSGSFGLVSGSGRNARHAASDPRPTGHKREHVVGNVIRR